MKLHSVVGLVTNSSSETFSMPAERAKELVFEHLQAVLHEIESHYTAEELFDVTIVSTNHDMWREIGNFEDTVNTTELYTAVRAAGGRTFDPNTWPEPWKTEFYDWFAQVYPDGPDLSAARSYSGDPDEDRPLDARIIVRNKVTGQENKKLSEAAPLIIDIFKNGQCEC